MKVMCAWCGEEMGRKYPKNVKSTTYGICDSCLEKVIKSAFPPVTPSPEVKEETLRLVLDQLEMDKVRSHSYTEKRGVQLINMKI